MNHLFIVLLIIFAVILLICIIHYILTLPERRAHKEILNREFLLYKEKCKAEQVKQDARIAGKIARDRINEIANSNK